MMRFTCNTKWWWALWLWGFEVSLVNSYLLYKNFCDENGWERDYNHYDFIEAVSKAWIDPINYWPTRNCLHLKHTVPTRTVKKRKQCVAINDKTICPSTRSLRCRRDATLQHFPTPVKKKKNPTQCQLHMWAAKNVANSMDTPKPKGARQCVVCCAVCHVHLCVNCYEIFHRVDHLGNVLHEILKE